MRTSENACVHTHMHAHGAHARANQHRSIVVRSINALAHPNQQVTMQRERKKNTKDNTHTRGTYRESNGDATTHANTLHNCSARIFGVPVDFRTHTHARTQLANGRERAGFYSVKAVIHQCARCRQQTAAAEGHTHTHGSKDVVSIKRIFQRREFPRCLFFLCSSVWEPCVRVQYMR